MPIIEGVGDEVIQFFGILLLIFLGIIAWWSTNISEIPHIRTVLIVERRSDNSAAQHPNLSQSSDRSVPDPGNRGLCQQTTLSANVSNSNKSELSENSRAAEPSNSNHVSSTDNKSPTSQNPQSNSPSLPHTENVVEPNLSSTEDDNIRIRLKYLNDDQKLVEGRLQELLGDFKRRHFRMELAAQKLVRLIFNGQVLQRDNETLAGCGLYDNCVVHCLVGQAGQSGATTGSSMNTPPPDWNLGGLLYVCLSLALALAWICRYNYAHLFTLTTTTALVGLTGMFAVSIVGLYMHDQDTQATTN